MNQKEVNFMSKRERFKDEIPFKEMTAAQKRSYLWDYWRMPVVSIAVIVVILISVIYTMGTSKEVLLAVTTVDAIDDTSLTPFVEEFAREQGIPADQLQVSDLVVGTAEIGGGANSQQGMALYVRVQAGSEDILILPEETFLEYASGGYFLDLTDIVTEQWQDKLIVAEQRYDDFDDVQPEPIACGIRMSDIPGMPDTPYYENAVIAISYQPDNYENAVAFLNYVLGQ